MKLRNWILLVIFVIGLVACESYDGKNENSVVTKPERFLEKEELINVMVDFRVAEAAIRIMASKGENTEKITPYYYQPMLDKYEITISEYNQNLAWYANDPEMMDDIYKEVVNRLVERQAEVRSQ